MRYGLDCTVPCQLIGVTEAGDPLLQDVVVAILLDASDLVSCPVPTPVHDTPKEREGCSGCSKWSRYGYPSLRSQSAASLLWLYPPSSYSLMSISDASTVFRLPHDLFREILLSFPVLPWTEVHFRYLHGDRWYRPIPETFWERARTLLALSATCRVIRQIALMEAWKYYVVWRWDPRLDQTGIRLSSRCEMLLGNPHLATHLR